MPNQLGSILLKDVEAKAHLFKSRIDSAAVKSHDHGHVVQRFILEIRVVAEKIGELLPDAPIDRRLCWMISLVHGDAWHTAQVLANLAHSMARRGVEDIVEGIDSLRCHAAEREEGGGKKGGGGRK